MDMDEGAMAVADASIVGNSAVSRMGQSLGAVDLAPMKGDMIMHYISRSFMSF
jgi:dsRNA-specific ribonuclease